MLRPLKLLEHLAGIVVVGMLVVGWPGAGTVIDIGDVRLAAAADPVTFKPVADARVAAGSPSSNYGTSSSLRARGGSSSYTSYLKFDVRGLTAAPSSVKLRLRVTDSSPAAGSVRPVGNDWSESTITYKNAPSTSAPALDTKGSASSGTTVEFDLGQAVGGDGVYSFAVTSSNTDAVYFSSKEGSTPPQLVVTPSSSPPPAGSVSTLFTPVADARVAQGSPSTNYGTSTSLRARGGSSPYTSYLKFDVRGLTAVPSSAKLRLRVTDPSPAAGSVRPVGNDWGESTITFNNAPSTSAPALDTKASVSSGATVEFDLGQAVAGNGVYSFALTSSHTDSVYFSSKEGSTPPQLVVTQGSAASNPPVTNFRASATSVTAGDEVAFTDTSTSVPTAWLWDFGDGTTSTLQNPRHVYPTAGSYKVTLTTTNAAGSSVKVKSDYIRVVRKPSTVVTYGGPPDCGTDVAPQLTTFLSSQPDGALVKFAPNGCYLLDGKVTISKKNNLTLDGSGARFERRTTAPLERGTSHFSFVGGSAITARNLTVKGNHPNAGTADEAWVYAKEAQHGFEIEGVQGMTLANVVVTDIYGDFVYVRDAATDVAVTGSRFERNGRQGVGIVQARGVTFRENVFNDVRRTVFDLEPNVNEWSILDVLIEDNEISRWVNRLVYVDREGTISGVALVGNVVSGRIEVYVGDGVTETPGQRRPQNLLIENNTSQAVTGATAFMIQDVDGLTIRGNYQQFEPSRKLPAAKVWRSTMICVQNNTFAGAGTDLEKDAGSTLGCPAAP